ncbi:hypothetical protein L596_012301 [Steinernema carpocapsae]|uniref:Uncharacterized protein n=1 Tax=Steinernema carpocapsae TaxID=34508 RepID=A0A4U5NWL6_STECR|nr:hypothetical protein L596_012301 [Steinernema carpocapsae]
MAYLLPPQTYFVILTVLTILVILITSFTVVIVFFNTPPSLKQFSFCHYNTVTWLTTSALFVCIFDRFNPIILDSAKTLCLVNFPVISLLISPTAVASITTLFRFNVHTSILLIVVFLLWKSFWTSRKRNFYCFLTIGVFLHSLVTSFFACLTYLSVTPWESVNTTLLQYSGYSANITRCFKLHRFPPVNIGIVSCSGLVTFLVISGILKKVKNPP